MMGLSELVLKVPATEVTNSRPPQPQGGGPVMSSESPSPGAGSEAALASSVRNQPVPIPKQHCVRDLPPKSKMKKPCSKTHSRESSGASNLSVRFTVNDETVRQVQTRNIGSDEDITLSDRLSQDLEEEELLDDDEDDDGFHPGSKSCESIPHDRLTPYPEDSRGMRYVK